MKYGQAKYGTFLYGSKNLIPIKNFQPDIKKYIKLYDKNHNVLDEIYEYSSLKYKFTLNGTGTAIFDVPLSSSKCNNVNFKAFNDIEIWEGSNCIWWGVVVNLDFRDSLLTVSCYDYLFLLTKVIEFPYTFANMNMTDIINDLLLNVNFFRSNTDFSLGHIDNALLTVESTALANYTNTAERIKQFMAKFNYDFDIDANKKVNIYQRKGSIKNYYTLQYGTDADNIIKAPQLSFSALTMANAIRSDGTTVYGTVNDSNSAQSYGRMGEEYSPSGTGITQNDLNIEINAELQRAAYPTVTISLTAIDSSLCPFNDLNLGDTVSIYLKNYWDFQDTLRIIEFEHDIMNGQRTITAGQMIYRPQPPKNKLYMR